jgi:hypothetical protein
LIRNIIEIILIIIIIIIIIIITNPFRHYSVPHIPEIEGISEFKGLIQHSKVYRSAEALRNLRVVILGAASSGADIGIEVSAVADEVRFSCLIVSVFIRHLHN